MSVLGYCVDTYVPLAQWEVDILAFHPITDQTVVIECTVSQKPKSVITKLQAIKKKYPTFELSVLRLRRHDDRGRKMLQKAQVHPIEIYWENHFP